MKNNFFIIGYLLILLLPQPDLSARDPEITINVPPQSLFEGSKIMFEIKYSDAHRLRWDFGDGSIEQGGPKHNHIYRSRGMYTVKVTDLQGKLESPLEKRIVIIKEGREIILENRVFFPGIPVRIKSRKFIQPPIRWDFGDGKIQTGGTTITHTYQRAGSFTIKAVDYAGQGLKTIEKQINIQPDNRTLTLPTEIISGEPADMLLQNSTGGTFTWEFSSGQRAAGTSVKKMTFQAPGTVTVAITDKTGVYPPLTRKFQVKPDRRKLKSSLTAALPGEDIRFTAEAFKGPVKWDFGDGTSKTGGGRTETHQYKNNGRYQVTARDSNGSSPKVFSAAVTIDEILPGFQVNLLEIAFNNGKYYQVVSRKSPPPSYYVKIKAAGRGILKGKWVLDNQPIGLFETLLHRNEIVDLRGAQVPPLPLIDQGPHTLTIEFSNYTFTQANQLPIIRYFVTETAAIDIISPQPGGGASQTGYGQLQWNWDSKFKQAGYTYQILASEIPIRFLTDQQIAEAWKPAGNTGTHRLELASFKRGAWVYWQVRAVAPGGEILTTSDISSFKLTK
jgi:PKD repeat protein